MSVSPFLNHVDEKYNGFVVTKVVQLSELNCVLRELVHEPSGASIMHIENDDPENLFCLSFKTYPHNSNGVAHILEHTVLCGSKKFPIKDPFFAMTRRSLNTFMNALTGADFTCYPAASQVEKDFYNLLDVYLDAVFHPQLKEVSFLQEGHRLEFDDPKDPNSLLEFKGIVYNEMKGSLLSRDTRLIHTLMQALCPDLTYAHNSGGDPKEIPNLTYEELIAFHETYYHPSRCLFFFYGNFSLKHHLDYIAENTLKNVAKQPPLPHIGYQKRFKEPLNLVDRFPINEGEDTKSMIAFGWLTVHLEDQKTLLALSVLDSILMDTDASPLKLPLLKSGLCTQAAAYMDTEMSEVPYLIICKGCNPENVDVLKKVLFETLDNVAKNGISHELIESAIHQLELSRTEIIGDHAPFGLTLFMRSGLAKQHQCPPENALLVHSLFEELLESVKDPDYLPSLIRKYFLENTHFVTLLMNPDPQLAEAEAEEERKKLKDIQENLTQAEKEKIIVQTEALKRYQKENEAQSLDCLPKVEPEDIPPKSRDFPLQIEKHKDLTVFHHDCFTNSIVYADLIFDFGDIEPDDLPYVHLLTSMASELGVRKRDYAENLNYIQAHTGGVSVTSALYVQASDPNLMKPCISIRGKALNRKADKLFPLLMEMATSIRFDEKERIEELIIQIYTSLDNRLNRNALRYAIHLSLSGFSVPSYISEIWNGLSYYHFIKDLVKDLKGNLPKIITKLNDLKQKLFCIKNPHLIIGCDSGMFDELHKFEFYGLGELPEKGCNLWQPSYSLKPVSSRAFPIASPVAFTCESFKTVAYSHPQAPALAVATHIMDNKILHPNVRERGGAYGVGAHYGPMLGHFYFHSYRDPHIYNSIKTFGEAIESIAAGFFDATDLEEAKLGMIQQLDAPIAPGGRALTAYSWLREGKHHTLRQKYRDSILALTPQNLKDAVETQLLPQKDSGIVVSFADNSLLERENAKLGAKSLQINSL